MRDPSWIGSYQAWMRLRGLRPASIEAGGNALHRLERALRAKYGVSLIEVTAEQLNAWQASLTLTAGSLASETAHAVCFYRWAHAEELIPTDPAVRLVRPKVPQRLPRPMAEEPLAVAIDNAPPDIRLMLILASYCGLRAGELAGLQRSDVQDTAVPPVVFIVGKGGRERIVPLSQRVLMELHAYRPQSRGPLFPRRDGHPGGNSPARVSQLVNGYLHELDIPDTLHSCRHRFGTRVYAGTPDIRVVQALMGHSDPATTAGYVAYSSAKAVEAVELLGNNTRPIVGAPSTRFT